MSFGGAWRALAPLVTKTLGATAAHPDRPENVALRRPSPRFEDTAHNVTPRAMQVVADADAGATALTLELPSGGGLAGTLQAGARLTLGAVEYTVAADAPATGTTLAVTLTDGLQEPAFEADQVTVKPEAVFTLTGCQVSRRRRAEVIAKPPQASYFAVITVPAAGQPTTPRKDDMVELEDGTTGRVSNQVISDGAFWKLNIGT